MARPPRVFLLERKNPKDRPMRQLRGFWSGCWSLLQTKKQKFKFTEGSHQNDFEESEERVPLTASTFGKAVLGRCLGPRWMKSYLESKRERKGIVFELLGLEAGGRLGTRSGQEKRAPPDLQMKCGASYFPRQCSDILYFVSRQITQHITCARNKHIEY